ncbi:MAG: hypothetical protein K1X75_10165 [Leptospirales bacterium]|nr:hypothetical protein [Leptospirales bacterium]
MYRITKYGLGAAPFAATLLFCSLASLSAQGVETIRLPDGVTYSSVGARAAYYRDSAGRLDLEKIRTLPESEWQAPADRRLNFGYSTDAIWIRFQVQNTARRPLLLEISSPLLDHVEVYRQSEAGDFSRFESGRSTPFRQREFNNERLLFSLRDDSGAQQLFVRVRSDSSLNCEMRVWSRESYFEQSTVNRMIVAMIYGAILLMAFYNLSLFFSIRDHNYLLYSLFQIAAVFFFICFEGDAHRFLFPDHPEIPKHLTGMLPGLVCMLAAHFSQRFLQVRENFPTGYWLLQAVRILSAFPFSEPWLGPLAIRAAVAMALIAPIVIFASAVVCAWRGYRPARFFLLAWSLFLLSSAVLGLAVSGILPRSFLVEQGVAISSVIEALLLSLALGDRIQMEQKLAFQNQAELAHSYARFVPSQFMLLLDKRRITEVRLGDAVGREMSVLFSDIRSFTSLSEAMTPEENFRFLNAILGHTGPAIRKHRGFIDKYMGDAIMALFPESPEDAVRAAITMKQDLRAYNARRASSGYQPLKIGIGINTGQLMLGTIGEPERMEGTVISDTVNLASRVEGLTKFYDATLLLTENTLFRMEDPTRYRYRIVDRVRVKGKQEPVSVFEIFDGDDEDSVAAKSRTLSEFEHGLQAYMNRDFAGASELFGRVLAVNPGDGAARLYRQRSERNALQGVGADWEGIATMDEK